MKKLVLKLGKSFITVLNHGLVMLLQLFSDDNHTVNSSRRLELIIMSLYILSNCYDLQTAVIIQLQCFPVSDSDCDNIHCLFEKKIIVAY